MSFSLPMWTIYSISVEIICGLGPHFNNWSLIGYIGVDTRIKKEYFLPVWTMYTIPVEIMSGIGFLFNYYY